MSTETLSPEDKVAKDAAKEIKRLRQSGNEEDAIAYGEEWLRANEAHPRVLCSLASVYIDKKDFSSARKYLNNALEIDPRNVVARNTLANLEMQAGNPHIARDLLKQTLEIDPRDVVARYLFAVADLNDGDLPLGIKRLVDMNKNGFNTPSMALLKKLATHGIGTNTYRQLFRAMEATGSINHEQLPHWEINQSVQESPQPHIPIKKLMPEIIEEMGQVARSQIFQADGRVPQPINMTSFRVAHNREPFERIGSRSSVSTQI